MKDIERKLIAELMKNSKKSDREIAKTIGISQPTVTRTRSKLEREGYIKEYTLVPDLHKLGYELLALTFVKVRGTQIPEEMEKIRAFTHERTVKTKHDLLMLERGTGLGYDGVIFSVHENYASYMDFRNLLRQYPFLEGNMESFLVSLEDDVRYLPLTFKILAKHMTNQNMGKKKANVT